LAADTGPAANETVAADATPATEAWRRKSRREGMVVWPLVKQIDGEGDTSVSVVLFPALRACSMAQPDDLPAASAMTLRPRPLRRTALR